MFCAQCGKQISDGVSFCPACGSPVQQHRQAKYSDPYVEQVDAQSTYTPPGQAYGGSTVAPAPTADYTRMGGWLLFFMVVAIIDVVFGVISAIGLGVGLSRMGGMLGATGLGSYSTYITVSIVFTIIVAALELYYVIQVFQKKQGFLRFYQIMRILSIVFVIIQLIMANSLPAGAAEVSGTAIGSLFGSALGLILITMYFCKSVRVRTYMGGTEYQRRALFRIGAQQ